MQRYIMGFIGWPMLAALLVGCAGGNVVLPQFDLNKERLAQGPPVPVALGATGQSSDVVLDPVKIAPEAAPGYENLPTTVTTLFDGPAVTELGLAEVVGETLANNRRVKIQGFSLRESEYGVPAARGIYDLLLSGRLTYFRNESQNSDSSRTLGVSRSRRRSGAAGVQQLLPTGAILSADFNVNNTVGGPYRETLPISLVQPLLRGWGPAVTNAQIRIAEARRSGGRADFQAEVQDQLAEALRTYWQLKGAIEEYKVQVISYSSARELLRVNREKVRVEVLPIVDEYQALAAAEDRRVNLIQARQAVRGLEDRLKRLIFMSGAGEPNWGAQIRPTQAFAWRELTLGEATALETAMACRPEIRRAESELRAAQVRLKVARNNVLPELNLVATATPNGVGRGFDEGYRNAESWKAVSYLGALEFSFPLQNRAARYGYKQAKAAVEQSEERLREARDQTALEVREALRAMTTARERITISQSRIASEEANLATEQQRLGVGLSVTFRVLDFQQRLAEAQSQHIRAIVDYNTAAIDLEQARGTLLATWGVKVIGAELENCLEPK